jgi:hypothetical protein
LARILLRLAQQRDVVGVGGRPPRRVSEAAASRGGAGRDAGGAKTDTHRQFGTAGDGMDRDDQDHNQRPIVVGDAARDSARAQADIRAAQAKDQADKVREQAKAAEDQAKQATDHAKQAEDQAKQAEARAEAQARVYRDDGSQKDEGGGWKKWAIIGGVGALLVLLLVGWGLYVLGDADQSALERLRDIAIIFIVLLFALVVVILAGIAAALAFLVFQIKDKVIPLLEELTATMRRFRGTAEFMTEEAVKPILSVASTYAKMRAMTRTVTGRDTKGRKQ